MSEYYVREGGVGGEGGLTPGKENHDPSYRGPIARNHEII